MDDNAVADQALDRYLSARESTESEELGALLVSHAEPVIRKVVLWRIGDSRTDAKDVCAEAMLSVLQRLQRFKEQGDSAAIREFRSYAASTAHHACDQYLRRKKPGLWQLRNRIRYVLEHERDLAVWRNSQGVTLCGLAAWKGREKPVASPSTDIPAGSNLSSVRGFLSSLFRRSSGPLELREVVELARASDPFPSREERIEADLADTKPGIALEIEQRRYAADLWKEILELLQRQRSALLLNLKNDAMNLLLLTGAASFRDIALALEMQDGELASLWNQLPLEDSEISQRLACTRQQVINLRMSARKRLANRLAGWR